jgi:hypothetical protein
MKERPTIALRPDRCHRGNARKVCRWGGYPIVRSSSLPHPQFLAEQNRLKNRFNFVVSNGDFMEVIDLIGAPFGVKLRTPIFLKFSI